MNITDDLHAFLWLDPTTNNANTYFINGEKRILIDPGHFAAFQHVRDHLARLSLTPEDVDLVIITHGHPDHMEAVRVFTASSTLIAVHASEMAYIKGLAPEYGAAMGLTDFQPQLLLKQGDLIVGGMAFRVIDAPGHSPGSLCLYWPETKVLFSGDVVFYQGIGRVDLPGGDGGKLKQSIEKLAQLEVEYLLPGHGEVVSGRERVKANFDSIQNLWFRYV
ncbi:MAG: MBL fold metallo-hydrolase [Deltaproteobacteria bacterium]|jgi:hydroxyacylglutathione hydrolase